MAKQKSDTSRIFLISVLISLCIVSLVAYQLKQTYSALWSNTEVSNQNLLLTVDSLLQRSLNTIDTDLQHIAFYLSTYSASANGYDPTDTLMLKPKVEGVVGYILVLDANGNLLYAANPQLKTDANFADRDYFKSQAANPHIGMYIGAPIFSRIDRKLSMPVSRSWFKADGSFGGVIIQTIKLDVLIDLFSKLNLGPHNGINILRRDGTALITFPYNEGTGRQSFAGNKNFIRYLQSNESSFRSISPIDSQQNFYSFRSLDGYPIILNTVQTTKSILAEWRINAAWQISLAVVFIAVCLVMAKRIELVLKEQRQTSERLRRTQRDMRTLVASIPAMVAYWGADYKNRFANNEHEKWFNITPEEMRGKKMQDVVGPNVFRQVRSAVSNALNGHAQHLVVTIKNKNNQTHYLAGSLIPDAPPEEINGFFALFTDITHQKNIEERLFQEKERFRVTLDSIKEAVIATDEYGCITYLNPAAQLLIGASLDKIQNIPIEQVIHFMKQGADSSSAVTELPIIKALERGRFVSSVTEQVIMDPHGNAIHIEASAAPIFNKDHNLSGAVMVLHNVSRARSDAQQMERLAQHDALTGLPNRRLLALIGAQSIARAERLNKMVGILFMDLDGFKNVNDSLGHAGGDQLLLEFSKRLINEVRLGDTLVRNGGDEFIVLAPDINNLSEIKLLATRLIESCGTPFVVHGHDIRLTISIGISVYPTNGNKLDDLIHMADQAMYRAKQGGRNQYSIFDNQIKKA